MTGPLRVAHFLASNFFGGPEKQLLEHVGRLNPQYFLPLVVSFDEGGEGNQLLEKIDAAGVVGKSIRSVNPFDPRMIADFITFIREEKIDLVCVHGYKANVIGRIASWVAGVPVIAISRGWTGEAPKIKVFELLDKLFLRFADHIVAVSHGQEEKILNLGIPKQHVTVIHNCITVDNACSTGKVGNLRKELGLVDDAVLVASAGRLSPEKNYAGMIEVARRVAEIDQKVHFVIFGEGVLRPELERQIVMSGLAERFLLPGFRTDLQAVLGEIDIFMLPSFTEGLPNVILEAFAARIPVVASAVGGIPEIVRQGVSGYLSAPEETTAMAEAVAALAADPDLRQRMGDAGHRYVAEHFTFEVQTKKYEDLYAAIHNRRRACP